MKIIEILRLRGLGMTQRQIAESSGCGKSTVGDLLKLCGDNGITYEKAIMLTDDELYSALYPERESKAATNKIPDWQAIHEEQAKHKKLNTQFMWEEYRKDHPDGLSYSRFCELYREYREKAGKTVSLYHERKAGEIMEVDWIGDTLPCVKDGNTGEIFTAHFFVAILGYSNYPYVEAFPNEREINWLTANVNALHYYGGIPRVIVPDNCKTAVKTPKYYEPVINSAYWEFAQHYEVAIVPARSRKPKDKPVVEETVGWLETWLLGKLRNQTFFSFHELNKTILKYLGELSARPFQKREGSRQSEFIKIDKPALRTLPTYKFEIADVVTRNVGDNYHIEFDGFYYSVPYIHYKEKVILRATKNMIEVVDNNHVRIASHKRRVLTSEGRYVTNTAHMPPHHKAVHESRGFDGNRYRQWAKNIGENTYMVIETLLSSVKVEEQGYKSCMGILQLSKKYSDIILETACKRARELGSYTYTTVNSSIKYVAKEAAKTPSILPEHENIRGSEYYK